MKVITWTLPKFREDYELYRQRSRRTSMWSDAYDVCVENPRGSPTLAHVQLGLSVDNSTVRVKNCGKEVRIHHFILKF